MRHGGLRHGAGVGQADGQILARLHFDPGDAVFHRLGHRDRDDARRARRRVW